MQCWISVPATDGVDDKIRMAYILLKTNIPAFHHSIIPFSGQIRKPKKTFILSVSCRNSETSTPGLFPGISINDPFNNLAGGGTVGKLDSHDPTAI